ncbi:MAG TPA: cob(I)yrinic acid a,c-diamide adenosyltransferase [Ktedonobacterales bacterium]|nr:cob(I)yrinic acid a,c-diamide adenosyltransferase [Ktedonobacterales bacterium]
MGSGKGLLIVYTGGGKGKTTAALGMAVRAVGYGHRVLILQFIKGSWHYGEIDGLKRLAPEVELVQGGEGFVGIIDDTKELAEHEAAARQALAVAQEKIATDAYDLVILDEINYALQLNLIALEDVKQLIAGRPRRLDLVLTGNHAHPDIVEMADLVTEMREIKHPFQQGKKAKRGIDF